MTRAFEASFIVHSVLCMCVAFAAPVRRLAKRLFPSSTRPDLLPSADAGLFALTRVPPHQVRGHRCTGAAHIEVPVVLRPPRLLAPAVSSAANRCPCTRNRPTA